MSFSSYNIISNSPFRCSALFINTELYDYADGALDKLFTCPSEEEIDRIRQQFDDFFYSDSVNQMDIEFFFDTDGRLETNQDEYLDLLSSIEFPILKLSNKPINSFWHYTISDWSVVQMPQPKGGEKALLNFLRNLFSNLGIKNKMLKKGFSFVCHVNFRGDIDDVIIVKSVSEKIDLKLMQELKEFSFVSGRKNGRPVDVWFLFDSKYYMKRLKELNLKN